MIRSLNNRINTFLFHRFVPLEIELHHPAPHVFIDSINHGRRDPLTVAALIVGIGGLASAGLAWLILVLQRGLNIPFFTTQGGMFVFIMVGVIVCLLVAFFVFDVLMTFRLKRFFNEPFCFECEYPLEGLVISKEDADTGGERSVRCPECGKQCRCVVITRHTPIG